MHHFGGKLVHASVKVASAWPSSCRLMGCLSGDVRREVQRLMIHLSFREVILLKKRRFAEEVYLAYPIERIRTKNQSNSNRLIVFRLVRKSNIIEQELFAEFDNRTRVFDCRRTQSNKLVSSTAEFNRTNRT